MPYQLKGKREMDEYSQIIFDKILSGYEFNYPEIALNLAKINPKLFCELAKIDTEVMGSVNYKGNYNNIIDGYIMDNKVIQAIKELRAFTGWGLKESKDYVDDRREQLGLYRRPQTTNGSQW